MGLMEMINLAHGEFLMLGMFGAWWLSVSSRLDPLIAIVPIGLAMFATHSDLAQTQCQFCHSTDCIVIQPRGDAKHWEGVVTKMIKIYGAPLNELDAKAIAEYLTKNYGPVK
jgi:hypothetical protein